MLCCSRRHRGFTFIDIMGAVLIIGTAIAAVMNFLASSTSAHATTGRMSTAIVLANNLHEYALSLDPGLPPAGTPTLVTHVLQLREQTFTAPLDGSLTDMDGRSLHPTVHWQAQHFGTGIATAELELPPASNRHVQDAGAWSGLGKATRAGEGRTLVRSYRSLQ